MQINHHSQIQPTLTRPDITDVTCLFLVGPFGMEISIQPIGRDVEAMIAVGRRPVFAGSDHANAVITHQTAHTTVAHS